VREPHRLQEKEGSSYSAWAIWIDVIWTRTFVASLWRTPLLSVPAAVEKVRLSPGASEPLSVSGSVPTGLLLALSQVTSPRMPLIGNLDLLSRSSP
jgi:hypothetical protein